MNEKENISQIVQTIIDAIQRGDDDKILAEKVKECKQGIDAYLCSSEGGYCEAAWEEFKDKALDGLRSTVNQCIKARKGGKRDDLKKYKEGYFNEIVQNANDVAQKQGICTPEFVVSVLKPEDLSLDGKTDQCYQVCCEYPDLGFTVDNIYGFCTKGNSDKLTEAGQEGAFGIGIKSLFCFVDDFRIDSNISLHIATDQKPLDICTLEKAKEWNGKTTKLTFSIRYQKPEVFEEPENLEKREAGDVHANFNIDKLLGFIDTVKQLSEVEESDATKLQNDLKRYLFNGCDKELLFDVRALLFTELRGAKDFGRLKTSIKRLTICYGNKEVCRCNVDSPYPLDQYVQDDILIKMSKISLWNRNATYMTFHFPKDDISLAFRYNQDYEDDHVPYDRLYATYFVKTDNYLDKDKPCGCLVNTKEINSSRSGLDQDTESNSKTQIMECAKYAVKQLHDIAVEHSDDNWKKISSDILHRLLWIYRSNAREVGDELIPLGIFEGYLNHACQENCLYLTGKAYVIKEEPDVCGEAINKNLPAAADSDNTRKIFDAYQRFIRKDDGMRWNDTDYLNLPTGIKRFITAFFENDDIWIKQLVYPLVRNEAELIRWRIGGESFEQIQNFLPTDDIDRILVKQLIGRFKVSDDFNFMGEYSDGVIRSWLFGQDSKDSSFAEKSSEFERSFGDLRNALKDRRHMINYAIPSRGYTEWWYFKSEDFYKEDNNQNQQFENEGTILQLLNLLSRDNPRVLFTGSYKNYGYYDGLINPERAFVHNMPRFVNLWNRGDSRDCSNHFYCFRLNLLKLTFKNFVNFKHARESLDAYNVSVDSKYQVNNFPCSDYRHLPWVDRCELENVNTESLEELFRWFSSYKNLEQIKHIGIKSIASSVQGNNDNDKNSTLIRFLKMFIDPETIVRLEKLTDLNIGNKKYLGYLTNLEQTSDHANKYRLCVRQSIESGWRDFDPVSSENEMPEKYLVIYYANTDVQKALSETLKHIGFDPEVCYYFDHFIRPGNIRQVSESLFGRFRKRPKVPVIQYAFLKREREPDELYDKLSPEDIFSLLSYDTSYDDRCPFCGGIPTLNIKGGKEELSLMENKNCMVVMLPAQFEDSSGCRRELFVQTICCKSCFEEYKNSLTSAEVKIEEKDRILVLNNRICSKTRERNYSHEFPLSPNNWAIIKRFNRI